MFGFFKPKNLLSDDDANFQIETYRWLLKYYGGDAFFKSTKLVLPTSEFFPDQVSSENEVALSTFNAVKYHAGMENWACELKAQHNDDIDIAPTIKLNNLPESPAGTFQYQQDVAIITYHPHLTNQPEKLVATFAHELSHYLTAHTVEAPFGGWENWEFATDITATFLGFGIFMCNSAFTFQQFQTPDAQGWEYSRTGYLSEEEHVFALVIFLKLLDIPLANAKKFLKPSAAKILKHAVYQIEQMNFIEELKQTQCVQPQTQST